MPQIKVTVPEEVHSVLKERAERDDRSLNNYLGRLLKQIASQPDVFSTPGILTTPIVTTPGPGIPTTPYQVTATTTAGLSQPVKVTAPTQTFTTTTATTPAKPKKSIIGDVDEYGNLVETPSKTETETKTEEKTYSSLPDVPTHTNPLKEKVKMYLDTYDVNPKDHSMATYKKLKEKFKKLDIETYDEIQHERAGD